MAFLCCRAAAVMEYYTHETWCGRWCVRQPKIKSAERWQMNKILNLSANVTNIHSFLFPSLFHFFAWWEKHIFLAPTSVQIRARKDLLYFTFCSRMFITFRAPPVAPFILCANTQHRHSWSDGSRTSWEEAVTTGSEQNEPNALENRAREFRTTQRGKYRRPGIVLKVKK